MTARLFDKRRMYSAAILMLIGILLLQVIAVPIMAAPNAYEDIIYTDRFEGNIGVINKVAAFLDSWLIGIISLVGFFIITAAMLRNVLTGAYVTYPRLFDMISAYKEDAVGKYDKHTGKREGGKYQGVLGWFLAILIPDIKKLTDFADDGFGVANPRQYFVKALFQGIVAVIIGVMIYNGLYRDLIAKGANLGTHVIQNYVIKFDLVGYFDKAIQTGRMYKFIWDAGNTEGDKQKNEVAKKVYTEVVNNFDDITTTETRAQVGQLVENYLVGVFKGEGAGAAPAIPANVTGANDDIVDTTSPAGSPDQYFGNPNYLFGFQVVNTEATVMPTPPASSDEGTVVFYYAMTPAAMGIEGYNPPQHSERVIKTTLTFRRTNRSADDAAAAAAQGNSVTANLLVQFDSPTKTLADGLTMKITNYDTTGQTFFASGGFYTVDDARINVEVVSKDTIKISEGAATGAGGWTGQDLISKTLIAADEGYVSYGGKNVTEIAFGGVDGQSTIMTKDGGSVVYGGPVPEPAEEDPAAEGEGGEEGATEDPSAEQTN